MCCEDLCPTQFIGLRVADLVVQDVEFGVWGFGRCERFRCRPRLERLLLPSRQSLESFWSGVSGLGFRVSAKGLRFWVLRRWEVST